MKEIKLTQGKVALVDDEDYEWLNQWKWVAWKHRNTYYAVTHGGKANGKYFNLSMHRIILNVPEGLEIDHIDHNGLNNQKNNIRICTRSQNAKNIIKYRGRSEYKGVTFVRHRNIEYIGSQIVSQGKRYWLGLFPNEISAAIAFDKKAKELHGEFANLNFK
jgi:hypothetical protein